MGEVSRDRSCFAEPTLVLGKDTEGIGVANDEAGDDAAGAVITLQDREPQLWGPQEMSCVRHQGFGGSFLSFFFFNLTPCGAARRSF